MMDKKIEKLVSDYGLTLVQTESGEPMLHTPLGGKAAQSGAMFEIVRRKNEIVEYLQGLDARKDASPKEQK